MVVLPATIVITILADALPINGLGTRAISESLHVYFVPAGYVFATWGIIYIGQIAYAVYQTLPSQKDNPRLQATGWWVVLGGWLTALGSSYGITCSLSGHWVQCCSCLSR